MQMRIPTPVARQFASDSRAFHHATDDAQREIVAEQLIALRNYCPDLTVWEILQLFDKAVEDIDGD